MYAVSKIVMIQVYSYLLHSEEVKFVTKFPFGMSWNFYLDIRNFHGNLSGHGHDLSQSIIRLLTHQINTLIEMDQFQYQKIKPKSFRSELEISF